MQDHARKRRRVATEPVGSRNRLELLRGLLGKPHTMRDAVGSHPRERLFELRRSCSLDDHTAVEQRERESRDEGEDSAHLVHLTFRAVLDELAVGSDEVLVRDREELEAEMVLI